MKKLVVVSLVLLVAIIGIKSFFSGGLSDRELRKFLENTGSSMLESSSVTVTKTAKLKDVPQLDNDSGNMLVLFKRQFFENGGTGHVIVAINTKAEKVISGFDVEYAPLNALLIECLLNGDTDLNEDIFDKFNEYIHEYGINFTENKDVCIKFIHDVTDSEGIIDTEVAKEYITQNLKAKYTSGGFECKDFELIFEEGNANPKFMLVEQTESEWAWYHTPESTYNYFDTETKNTFRSLFGEPYKMVSVWVAYDTVNFKEVYEYKSKWHTKESAIEDLKSKILYGLY